MARLPASPSKFQARKREILDQLSVPTTKYTDASPKGSVDEGIRHLISEVNGYEGLVTTSSCAGRVSVFLEGKKKATVTGAEAPDPTLEEDHSAGEARLASAGGKGGGAWLFVSHDPIKVFQASSDSEFSWTSFLGLGAERGNGDRNAPASTGGEVERLIHFKFEPMILHILTASIEHAQLVLRCALEAGFRESGAINISEKRSGNDERATPMVAVRSMGLLFESLIGTERYGKRECMVNEAYLWKLVSIANDRFVENQKRIERFRSALERALSAKQEDEHWEPKEVRLGRKRAEGLRRKEEVRRQKEEQQAREPGKELDVYGGLPAPEFN